MEIKTEFQKLKERINSMDRPFENYDLCGCNDMSPNTLRKTVRWFMKAGRYIDRIDPIRLNFLWGLRTALYQQEKYENINDINEIIENEFGKEAVNHISHEDFLDMI